MTRPHGIMFHRFHGPGHPPSQGSLSADNLSHIIRGFGRRIVPAQDWMRLTASGQLPENAVCLTMDDGLLSQLDIALPVLDRHNLTAFWFIPTSPMMGQPVEVEVHHWYKSTFAEVDDFYRLYHERSRTFHVEPPDDYLRQYPFYTDADRRYRWVRDRHLKPEQHRAVMAELIGDAPHPRLWLSPSHLKRLHRQGHVLGLHTHTHPTAAGDLPDAVQEREWATASTILRRITGDIPHTAAYPCNSYNPRTPQMLRRMGVKIAFRSNMEPSSGPYELPREDCANLRPSPLAATRTN